MRTFLFNHDFPLIKTYFAKARQLGFSEQGIGKKSVGAGGGQGLDLALQYWHF